MTIEADLRLDPYPMYAEMRQKSPVLLHPKFGGWLLTRYEDVRRVFSDHQTFSSVVLQSSDSELYIRDSIQRMDPPRHTRFRALAAYAFTPNAVTDLEPRIRAIAGTLLDAALQKSSMDFVKDFAEPLPVTVIAEMLGVRSEDQGRFRQWSNVIFQNTERMLRGIREELPEHVETFREMRACFRGLLSERRAKPQADLISRLAQAEVEGQKLTDAEAVEFCLLLMAAGNETTTNLLTNGMRSFLDFPEQWTLLCQNPDLIPQAVEEIMRFRSPVQCLPRIATRDVELGGQTIKAGDRLFPSVGSANRDESKFENADRFDVTRPASPHTHMTMGYGIHYCLGAPLARLESKIALQVLTKRVKDFRLQEGAVLEPLPTFIIFGLRHLHLQVNLHPA